MAVTTQETNDKKLDKSKNYLNMVSPTSIFSGDLGRVGSRELWDHYNKLKKDNMMSYIYKQHKS